MNADTWLDGSILSDVLWQSTFFLLLACVAGRLVTKHPARAHGAMVMCIGAAIGAPIASLVFREAGWGLLSPIDFSQTQPTVDGATITLTGANHLASWWSVQLIAGALWACVATLAVGRLVVAVRRSRQIIKTAGPVGTGSVKRAALAASKELSIGRTPELRASDAVTCPVIWCWSRSPLIIVPTSMLDADDSEELFAVMCHELAHFKRRDHWWSLLGELASCALCWHPLIWWSKRRLGELSEQACDHWVLAAGQSPTAFAQALLSFAPQARMELTLAAASSRTSVGRRISYILQRPTGRPSSGRVWAIAVAVVSIGLLGATSMAHRRPAEMNSETTGIVETSMAPLSLSDDDSPFMVRVTPHELDLGAGPPNEIQRDVVWLINTSDEPVDLEDVKVDCGCTQVSGFEARSLAPGERMQLEIAMTALGTPGKSKTKHVTFLIAGQPPMKLPVHLATASTED